MHASAVARLSHLTQLEVDIELNSDATDFAAEYHQDMGGTVPLPPLNQALAHKVTENLFRDFFEHNSYAKLVSLEVCFIRVEIYDRGQSHDVKFPIKIVRSQRDDAPSPHRGGFTIECEGKWLGRWYEV